MIIKPLVLVVALLTSQVVYSDSEATALQTNLLIGSEGQTGPYESQAPLGGINDMTNQANKLLISPIVDSESPSEPGEGQYPLEEIDRKTARMEEADERSTDAHETITDALGRIDRSLLTVQEVGLWLSSFLGDQVFDCRVLERSIEIAEKSVQAWAENPEVSDLQAITKTLQNLETRYHDSCVQ